MKISGFQKLTLLDFPGHVAATIFTGGCNLRCPFCHNALLVTELDAAEEYSQEEILSYLKKRSGVLDGVCITGGEPLMQPGIEQFIKKVKDIGIAVKLDTNGTFPERLNELISSKLLDYVAMDIKNSKDAYAKSVGLTSFDVSPVEQSVSLLLRGNVDYEFRTTVVRELHKEENIEEIAKWICGAKRYFLQNFVDSGNLIGENLSAVSPKTLDAMRVCAEKYIDFVGLRGI